MDDARRLNTFLKRTRRGKLRKIVRERYLRDDLPCGSVMCSKCTQPHPVLSSATPTYIVLDSNVVLHQIDVLEHQGFVNIIVLQTVLLEVKHRNRFTYNRLRTIIAQKEKHFFVFYNEFHKDTAVTRQTNESANDFNDRAIRRAASWYGAHLPDMSVVLLTNDRANLKLAKEEGIPSHTIHSFVRNTMSAYPELVDMLAEAEEAGGVGSRGENVFDEHLSPSSLKEGAAKGELFKGVFHVSRTDYSEGWVRNRELDEDVFIKNFIHMNRATEGDVVMVELLPREEWSTPSSRIREENAPVDMGREGEGEESRPEGEGPIVEAHKTGKVVGISRRNWRPLVGALQDYTGVGGDDMALERMFFSPKDKRLPKVLIKTRQAAVLRHKRIVVALDRWDRHSLHPTGHYVRTLGEIGDREAESEALLIQYDVPYMPFSQRVLACLPPTPWSISAAEIEGRTDLRGTCVFSIDPPGCTDIDDALHVVPLPNGNLEVGVHIADVTHYVLPGTAINEEAARRSTSVYLCDRRIDMLPRMLSTDVCSLVGNADRLAFSVIWEMSPAAEIVRVMFTKSVIHSRAALSYGEAQTRMDSDATDEISENIRHLNRLARQLKSRRLQDGALTLASAEVRFKRDEETQDPIDVELYQTKETNSLVEEFMLLANVSVAKKIYDTFGQFAMLRRHPVPSEKNFFPLLATAATLGIDLDTSSSKVLADSLDAAEASFADKQHSRLIRILTTKCMTQAVYFSSGTLPFEEFRHYGLAMPIYTHFTSPIRRYADVIVHRALAAAIGVDAVPADMSKRGVERIAAVINRRHRMAQMASRGSVELHILIYFRGKCEEHEAYITEVKSNGFVVHVPRYGMNGTIEVPEGQGLVYSEERQELRSESLVFRVFDKVTVEISVDASNEYEPRVQLLCVQPRLHERTASAVVQNPLEEEETPIAPTLVCPADTQVTKKREGAEQAKKSPKKRKKRKGKKKGVPGVCE